MIILRLKVCYFCLSWEYVQLASRGAMWNGCSADMSSLQYRPPIHRVEDVYKRRNCFCCVSPPSTPFKILTLCPFFPFHPPLSCSFDQSSCHGAALLPSTLDPSTQKSIIHGKRVTGFTTKGEEEEGVLDTIKSWNRPTIEAAAESAGAICESRNPLF